ncbi:OmpA family protein [Spirosoma utsteinense]|uniref:Outer membrane protein OmpA-like peptidoglycan-associated protein n=1 Tax=Spirosoma utsteinense TaxID=2585773 RepID=A0ABR6W1Q0_9BACT|nr:OmpA family protein [Spirosoma utsteinense]MBC3785252.1 outer membrane protein OmpA-like peptidoglycan-associated protein [Spirosoma utsteinense]MBC3790522.1 outer membrane protein OmpA-like peptidoglycan-associated protein [Spirosoma utsteinense]
MRFLLISLFCLLTVTGLYGQKIVPNPPTRTFFSIRAVDDESSAEVAAQFTIKALTAKRSVNGQSKAGGAFVFLLTQTDTLTVVASAPGYYESEETMVISCDTCPDYAYVIRLEKEEKRLDETKPDSIFRNLAVNQVFRLDNVYFDQSSYVLRAESYPQLRKLAATLKSMPGLQIEIAGHTDNVGDRRLNQALSENRARVIRNYLIRNGISENRLRPNGYGDSRPAAPNDSEENKRKNRRVEFVVLAL